MKNKPLLKSLRSSATPRESRKFDIFAGFFVDAELNSQIVLMAVSQGKSKSDFVRSIIRNWLEDKDPIKEVVDYVKGIRKDYDVNDEEFNDKLASLLENRGVSKTEVSKVLKAIKKLK